MIHKADLIKPGILKQRMLKNCINRWGQLMITKNNGFEFLDFLVVKEAEMFGYHRLAGSYAVIKSKGKYLMCYNTLREQWELPAGQREEDETPNEMDQWKC